MSLTALRAFYRDQLEGLGFKEWEDAFDFENIPSTLLDGSFHMELGLGVGGVISQHAQKIQATMTIRVFRGGFKNSSNAVDQGVVDIDNILCDILAPNTRLGDNIKNVVFNGYSIKPLSDSNGNAIITEINFNNIIFMNFS